jgi:hypothetical protein
MEVATSGRRHAERRGVALSDILPCDARGRDGTDLAGCGKLYLALTEGPASERPFAFVLQLARDTEKLWFGCSAFGLRHPDTGIRSVYERAHRQLHGRFPE